jgi:hypothetical protein
LIDYAARHLQAVEGRFLQADTVIPVAGALLSYNRYIYVNNNPVKFIDPTGHAPDVANENPATDIPRPGAQKMPIIETEQTIVRWTWPHEDGVPIDGSVPLNGSGTVAGAEVRMRTEGQGPFVTEADWASGVVATAVLQPKAPGTADSTIVQVNPETGYYLNIRTWDDAGNWSPLSNNLFRPSAATAGVGDQGVSNSFLLLGNPGKGAVAFTSADNASVTYRDVQGREIEHRDFPGGSHSCSPDARLESGLYFVTLETQGHSETKKFVVRR